MISADDVMGVLDKISAMTHKQVQALVAQLVREQPIILAFLLATSEREKFDQNERELFLLIGVIIWQIVREDSRRRKRITGTLLQES